MTTITMTMKNVVTSARRAVAALALAGLAASAEAADGSIYSIDLVSDSAYGGMVPTESSPLTIGQKAVIRVRMANSNYNDPTRTSNPKPWRVMPTAPYTGLDDTIKLLYPMQIGLMFGGQPVYADYIATAAPATPAATYTDFYFQYTVKSGDLAMPAQLMTADGKAAGSSTSADYMLGNSTFWEIVNDDGDEAVFHYTTSVSMDPVPGEPQSKSVSGVGMGLYVKTVDFDNSYIEPAATATETGTWRRIHNGLTTTSSTLPSVVVNGTPETALTMYVWVDDESIAAPLTSDGAEEVTDTYQVTEGGSTVTKTVTRHVLPISFAANADPTKTFRLKGVSIGNTVVRMSSSKNLVCDDLGYLVENWVERPIEVIVPPEPYAAIEILDRSMASSIAQVACPTNYKDYVAVMKLTLNGQAPTAAVTMTITPSEAVCPEDEEDRRIGISESPDAAELPWLDRKLSVTFSAGETEKYLYIYALDQTEDLAGKVQFTPTLSGAGAGDYTGEAKSGNLSISPVKPVILSPTSGEQLSDAIAGQTYPLDLVIAGSYRAIRRTDWTVRLKSAAFGDPDWHIYSDGLSIDAESGEATVDVLFTVEKDDAEVQIVLVDPQDENSKTRTSATVKAKIDVTAPKKAWATFDRGAAQYAESRTETAKVYFNISQPSDSAKALYAFLRPLNDDANNKVKSAAFTTATTSQGVYIGPGETDSGTGYAEISLLDGNCSALFEVVICTESTYSAAKEASYVSGQCTLNVTNVVPTIRSVSMGGSSVKVSGGTMAKQIALGIPKKFTVDIDDPGLLDLEATGTDSFLVQWKFSGGEWQDRPGNPSTTSIENAFATPGVHEVVVRCQDKDMRANSLWTEEFSFYVNVLESPKVEIVSAYGLSTFDETMTGDDKSRFNVSLNVPPDFTSSSDRLVVDLTVSLLGDASAYDDGDCVLSKSQVSFASGQTSAQTFYLKTLDGTQESASSGFRITASVSGTSATDTEGKTWDAGEVEFTVVNAAPSIKQPVATTDADGKPISQSTTIGETQSQTWSISDVAADVEGMTVTWVTSEGQRMEYVQGTGTDTDSRKYVTDARSGTHTFYFTGSGEKTVTMTVTDKDGGQNSVTLYYTIAASKTMEILPHGPSSGNGTSLSAKYHDKAAGLGKGKVWTANAATKIANWVFSYGCGLDSEFRVFGKGYRVSDVDDTVGPTGNAIAAGGTGYTYPDAEFDSFFYAWLQLAKADGSSTLSDSLISVSPEHPEDAYTGTMVSLPTEKDDDGNYAKTILEAIFSREYLASDNMGDINLDGIPDAYVKKYGMGVFDDDGNLSGNDLEKLASYNDDNDVLPDGRLFTAKLEIRGFGEGLNDAPTLAGLNGFKPDRRYTDPDVDAKSTLTKLEYLAWLDYAAANGLTADSATDWTKWSPERPTDPTDDDTDEDGFSDAFEYYYWYRAHVGYFQTSVAGGVTVSNHVYLTGRRFEPGNPEGSVITSETIARLMDPITASGDESDAETRDTDNDGLPDLLEFELGTNPFDFDTDGDGLPDGWEVLISGTDPTLRFTEKDTIADPDRNYDGDHMAYTAVCAGEDCEEVAARSLDGLPTDNIKFLTSFAVADSSLGEAGVQWYVVSDASVVELATTTVSAALTTLEVYDGKGLWTEDDSWTAVAVDGAVTTVDAGTIGGVAVQRLSVDVEASRAFLAEKDDAGAIVRGLPKRLAKGSFVRNVGAAAGYVERSLAEDISCQSNECNKAWFYGLGTDENKFKFGELAIGPDQSVSKAAAVLAAPTNTRKVAYLHSYVYQEFGFDPRTAWSSTTPLAPRWGSVETLSGSRVGTPQRTRPYTAYDEFLLMSYWLKSDCIDEADLVADPKSRPWSDLFALYTTNPHGPDETLWPSNTVDATTWDTNGADTDKDGVPDGWELYVMSGPKDGKAFKILGPEASMSPLTADSDRADKTDVPADNDGLTQVREFAGTDSVATYTNVSTTIVRPADDVAWLNKFFPTDPWNADTDGDTVSDSGEREAFAYGEPVDDGSTSICGGGLNPCSVDTDGDGLPDGWELQFAGTFIESDAASTTGTNVVAGASCITNGMDGTYGDALLDYDKDGLENWQEYLVGTMRCWRYDDPISPFVPPAYSDYFDENGALKPNLAAFGCATLEEFLYKTAFDQSSSLYNPQFVTDASSGAQYFTRLENPWDPVYTDDGAFYVFPDRAGTNLYSAVWTAVSYAKTGLKFVAPSTKYISCDPTRADTDRDGMDDYYELFHGLNPLLGANGVRIDTGLPCDVVFDALYSENAIVPNAEFNRWTENPWKTPRGDVPEYDFEVFTWLNGLATADPDGDDIRNQDEALMPKLSATGFHTDPSPLWMTDSTYTNSLVSRFFRLPTRFVPLAFTDGAGNPLAEFEYGGVVYALRDIPGAQLASTLLGPVATLRAFVPDFWQLAAAGRPNWMFSFEQNEGYDTDHDGHGDYDERAGKFTPGGTDPLDAESPTRRQAMYFQGASRPSLLQAMLESPEQYPVRGSAFANEYSFSTFTAECWVCPETLDDATILERDVWTDKSNPGDQEFLRRNFHLAVRFGKWYGCFDSNGTVDGSTSGVYSKEAATANAWTHLALTYDGRNLILYVNGVESGKVATSVTPESGSGALWFSDAQNFIGSDKYAYVALLVGASAKNYQDIGGGSDAMLHLDVLNGLGLGRYKNFYKGYVDEVRVWDGARTAAEVAGAVQTRYTADLIKANRAEIYDCWAQGYFRYATNGIPSGVTVPAELRYRYSFDSVPGAENANQVAKVPAGFGENGDKPPVSRPEGYAVSWWDSVVNGDGVVAPGYGSVYNDPSWVTWIPNAVAHLPRFDGTTLDSFYWSEDFQGDAQGAYTFVHTAEPVSLWTQMLRWKVEPGNYWTTSMRHSLIEGLTIEAFEKIYRFAGRNRNTMGDDLLPLGGAFAKYVPASIGFWDGQGASSTTAVTGIDADNDGLPDWWQTYANSAYRWSGIPSGETVTWDTIVDYNGLKIAAWEAYLRDLAKGMYVDKDGNVQDGSGEYVQRADSAAAGVPDWWMELYGIKGESGLDDHDNDGLPNYVEYLLSEVFRLQGVAFDPTRAESAQPGVLDYFYKVGDLYVGEIFTDHDLVDDSWESVYSTDYASRLKYDPYADADLDGWSNRSENRYAKQCMPIVADEQSHYTAGDGLLADYPIPTVELTLRYDGVRRDEVSAAPLVVQTFTGANLTHGADATFNIAGAEETASSGTSSADKTSDKSVSRTRTLGGWSNRHVVGTLTPGYINKNSLALQFCYDPTVETYNWEFRYSASSAWYTARGTRKEYDAAKRKYGDANVSLLSRGTDYVELDDVEVRSSLDSQTATWIHTKSGQVLGTVDLTSGAFDLDLGVFKDQYVVNSTNSSDRVSLEDQFFRIAYSTNPSVGLPRKLYLGEADTGYVREGKNQVFVWADLNDDGVFTVGEPCGYARDVDISWRTRAVTVELLDHSPITPRIDMLTPSGDRGKSVTDYCDNLWRIINEARITEEERELLQERLKWTTKHLWNAAELDAAALEDVRVRVVRWVVDGNPVYRYLVSPEVVFDQKMRLSNRSFLSEADFLATGALDLDWDNLKSGVVDNINVQRGKLSVTNMAYLVVIGDGKTFWESDTDTNSVPVVLDWVIERRYSVERATPTPLNENAVVYTAQPTLKWSIDGEDRTDYTGYTAFKVKVASTDGAFCWTSDFQRMPPVGTDGAYAWNAPLFAGDRPAGATGVFENGKTYTWSVSVYNSKFRDDAFVDGGSFLMGVQTNGYETGTIRASVRYYGPAAVTNAALTRVRAYTSPDFSGDPVGSAYVTDPDADGANCRLVGLPAGTYYLQAFVDSNGNGVWDKWESMGYLCQRDGTTADYLNPISVTIGGSLGLGGVQVIYIEDADTDGDNLPDAWEYVQATPAQRADGSFLKALGVDTLSETGAAERWMNNELVNSLLTEINANLVPTAGLMAQSALNAFRSSTSFAALAMGVSPSLFDATTGALVVNPTVDGDTVAITDFAFDAAAGKVVLKVTADVDSATVASSTIYTVTTGSTVTVKVLHTDTLAGDWTTVATRTVKVSGASLDTGLIEVDVPDVSATGGFYKVEIEE